METGAPGVLGPPVPGHVDLATEERLEPVTTQLHLTGDKTVLDQAVLINLVTLNPVQAVYFLNFILTLKLLALSRHHSSFLLRSRSNYETFFGFRLTDCQIFVHLLPLLVPQITTGTVNPTL